MVLVRSWRPCENGGGTQSQTEYTASELIEEDMQILLMYGQFQSAVNRSAKSVFSVVVLVWFGLFLFICQAVPLSGERCKVDIIILYGICAARD